MKRFLALVLATVTVLCLASCKDNAEPTEPAGTAGTASGTPVDPDAVFLSSEHYTITTREFQYFLAKVYDDFASQYGEAISYMLDTSKPLKEQSCPVDQTGKLTWFEYFADGAYTSVEGYLLLAEEALSVGYEIPEEEKALIEKELALIDTTAKEKGYNNVDDYVNDYYGTLMTKDHLKQCFYLFYISNSYRAKLYNEYAFTEEEYLEYANKNKGSCYVADFMYMRLTTDIAEGDSDEVKAEKWAEVKEDAKTFNNSLKDRESFVAAAEAYMRKKCTIVEDEKDSDYQAYKLTEEQIKAAAEATYTENVAYSTGTANVDWIFAEGRLAKEQTIIVDEENYSCEIIYMVEPAHLNDQPTVNVRHLLVSKSDEGDEYKAASKAQALYDQWLAGDTTEDSFAILATKNTADAASAPTGGLYESVVPGQMVAEFNDWCFDPARKSGDTGIVDTTYGSHIMYFVSHGMPKWKSAADTGLRDAKATALVEELKKEHQINVNRDNMNKCPDLFGE